MEQTAQETRTPARNRLATKSPVLARPAPAKFLSTPVVVPPPPPVAAPESDQDLMRKTQEGDSKAFAVIYERYSASVLSYLYRMLGNIEDVEAIAQEVFLRAFRFRATYRYPQRLSTWLFTISRNLAINHARRKKRSPVRNVTELNLDGIDVRANACEGVAQVQKREEIARLLAALDELPPDQKEVIVLGIFQDLSYAEMEAVTGAKAVTLRSRMFHGLKKLAKRLNRDER